MREVRANILSPDVLAEADAVCVTTNGIIKANGRAVMGAGVAKSFRDAYPGCDEMLAKHIRRNGHVVGAFMYFCEDSEGAVVSFPTKQHWKNPSDIRLIHASAMWLEGLADMLGWKNVWLPRPGCSNGGLDWADVKPVIEPFFDDRFTVCYL